jgi:hypothetical protein
MSVTQELVYETSLDDVSSQPQALGAEPIEKSSQVQGASVCVTVPLAHISPLFLKLTENVLLVSEEEIACVSLISPLVASACKSPSILIELIQVAFSYVPITVPTGAPLEGTVAPINIGLNELQSHVECPCWMIKKNSEHLLSLTKMLTFAVLPSDCVLGTASALILMLLSPLLI